ncbi:hypothetical protein [Actinomadura welshii]|uniref:hypothetical protein n=1 Tax=Actinomadura welshii TaxID=3103817 RepID=UPI0003AD1E68|nr:hypothetical protein [Actinomadura madurae]
MNENAEETRPWLRVMKEDCPVGAPQQAWIEASMTWFASEFGREPMLGGIVLPGPSLASGYEGTPRQINRLIAGVCTVMSLEPSDLVVEFFDLRDDEDKEGRRAVGHYSVRYGRPVIGLDVSEASDAEYLTAIIAHELCHVRLLGEGRITTERKDHERLTDLLTVYFGFGIFSTNAALRFADGTPGFSVRPLGYLDERALNAARSDGYSRVGYLTEPEFGYAMACYAWLREETEPSWARHLDPGPRTHLEQGLAYLSRCAPQGRFPTTRTGGVRITVHVRTNTAARGVRRPFPVFTRGGARPAR